MYKSFNETMTLIRGAGRGLESMGLFSLFGDERWRIPTPFSHQDHPCENDGIKDEPAVNETVDSLAFDSVNWKAPTQSPHRNQQFNYNEMKEKAVDKKAAHFSLIDTENEKMPTDPFEPNDASIILFQCIVTVVLLFLLGICIQLLVLLPQFIEWLIDSLAWLLDIPPPFFTVVQSLEELCSMLRQLLFFLGLLLVCSCLATLKANDII